MATVLEFEIPQMIKCFSMFGEDYKPRLAVVVVQKRISTRIFGQGPQGYQNPPPGTVLDHTITRKGWYDFFLVSQHVRQITVTPTHYNVVADNTGTQTRSYANCLTIPTMMIPPISGMSQLSIKQKAPSSTEQKTPPNNAQPPQSAKTSPPVAAPLLNGEMKQGTNGHSVPLGANYLALQTRIY